MGLAPERATLLGRLAPHRTGTGFLVHPWVARIDRPGGFAAQPGEVEEIFEVPFAFFLDADNHVPHTLNHAGQVYHLHAMPWQGYEIWGATAGILHTLYRCVAAGAPELLPRRPASRTP